MKQVLIQLHETDKFPFNEDIFQAYLGFSSLGYECIFKTFNDLIKIKSLSDLGISELECCAGTILFTRRIAQLSGKKYPDGCDYPKELEKYLGRGIECKPMEYLNSCIMLNFMMNQDKPEKLEAGFIKPYKQKQFYTGIVKTPEDYENFKAINAGKYEKQDLCYVSEVINIKSEWRNYVHKNILIDSKCYGGDFKIFPDYNIIEQMISDYSESGQVAYGLDVGVTDGGKTVLIEVNPALALGNYGLSYIKQAEMILDCWKDLKIL